jgi:hypothetical protein
MISIQDKIAPNFTSAKNTLAGDKIFSQRRASTPALFVSNRKFAADSSCEAQDSTVKQKEFSAAVAEVKARHQMKIKDDKHGMISVRAYLDARDYESELAADKKRPEPGSIQLIYMFYSRVYDKLIGKQKGIEVNLFSPIDLSERLLGFHGILDFARDFKLIPSRTNRSELERFYITVHTGVDAGESEAVKRKFESKISYYEFVELLALCTEGGEPMDRSRVDRSTVHAAETRLERVKRLASLLGLTNTSKVRLALHNAYRDVYFLKLGDGMDFEKEVKAIEIRSRPQRRVELLPESRRLDRFGTDAAALKYLSHFAWRCKAHDWEEIELPIIDMGSAFVNEPSKHCRLTITNRQLFLARVRLQAIDLGSVRLPWEEMQLSPGQSVDAQLEFAPVACGEWCGSILISAEWVTAGGYEKVSVPTYMRVMDPETADDGCTRLPLHASPLKPGSATYACHVHAGGLARLPVLP